MKRWRAKEYKHDWDTRGDLTIHHTKFTNPSTKPGSPPQLQVSRLKNELGRSDLGVSVCIAARGIMLSAHTNFESTVPS